MKILIATDAWTPQINGVVRSLQTTCKHLQKMNHTVDFLTPDNFNGFVWPFYKEIKICYPNMNIVEDVVKKFQPECIHIATEGPVGLMMRHYCIKNKLKFTTSYHTRFPEYLKSMHHIPLFLSYAYFRWFHSGSSAVMVPTTTMIENLHNQNFKNLTLWNRGVDLENFKPYDKVFRIKRPIVMYVGRVSIEKNLHDFVNLKTSGTKVVVGEGPLLDTLRRNNPEIFYVGAKHGQELARWYSQADVIVFPSRSDTYGLVLLEALACGVPFAAYPESGPLDIVNTDKNLSKYCCFIDSNLNCAVDLALQNADRNKCREFAHKFSWEICTEKFANNIKRK